MSLSTHTKQVCPYIARLGVNTENGLEACAEGGEGRAVVIVEKVVVLEPIREVVVMRHLPRHVLDLLDKLVGEFVGLLPELPQVQVALVSSRLVSPVRGLGKGTNI